MANTELQCNLCLVKIESLEIPPIDNLKSEDDFTQIVKNESLTEDLIKDCNDASISSGGCSKKLEEPTDKLYGLAKTKVENKDWPIIDWEEMRKCTKLFVENISLIKETSDENNHKDLDIDELLGDFGNLAATEIIKLDRWLLFVAADMKGMADSYIKKLKGPALRDYHLDISNPSMIIIPSFSEILTLIESYIGMQYASRYKLVMVILPKAKSQTFFTQIKAICNKYAVPSQLMLNSTLIDTSIPLNRLLMSIKEKASMKGYNNSIEILGKDAQAMSKYDIANKIFAGTINTPHKARYQAEGGTVKITGLINFENDKNKIIEYERISLINWPTFYTNDRVTFRVELSSSGHYFRVFELKIDPLFLSNPSCPIKSLKRFKGKLVDYRYSTYNGKILDSESQSEVIFRIDECLDKLIKDLTIGDLLEYSVIQMEGYRRAIRITKLIN